MKKNKVCWKITTKCNQKCKYCFGFSNIKELSYNENKKVLSNLIKKGLTDITWTGGEAVLYPELNKLMKIAKAEGVHNKLVTNGIFLAENDNDFVKDILENLDELNLSIDSTSNEINLKLGKENNHFDIIKKVLEKTKGKNLRIGINTVVSKVNANELNDLGKFLNNYEIFVWKFLKFMPIRERALENKNLFEISENELEHKLKELGTFENIKTIKYKKQAEFEKSFVILPNADIIKTENGIDINYGNALEEKNIKLNWNDTINKIRTLIAYDDETIKNKIVNILTGIEDVEIIATSTTPMDTFNKIIEFRPEMVFAKYSFCENMNGLDIIRQSKKVLKESVPTFNFIAMDIPKEEYIEAKKIIGDKMNTVIREQTPARYVGIINDYKEYIND